MDEAIRTAAISPLRQRLIDDYAARLIHVGVAKVASGQQGRAVRDEVVRRHSIKEHTLPVWRRLLESLDPEERAASRA